MASIADFETASQEVDTLETSLAAAKARRSDLAKALYDQDGKGHPYVVGGKEMVVSRSKGDTWFLTPKKKTRRKKATVEVSATLTSGSTLSEDEPAAEIVQGTVETSSDPLASALQSAKQ